MSLIENASISEQLYYVFFEAVLKFRIWNLDLKCSSLTQIVSGIQ